MFLNIHKFLYNNPSYKGKALPELDIITILSVYFRELTVSLSENWEINTVEQAAQVNLVIFTLI